MSTSECPSSSSSPNAEILRLISAKWTQKVHVCHHGPGSGMGGSVEEEGGSRRKCQPPGLVSARAQLGLAHPAVKKLAG